MKSFMTYHINVWDKYFVSLYSKGKHVINCTKIHTMPLQSWKISSASSSQDCSLNTSSVFWGVSAANYILLSSVKYFVYICLYLWCPSMDKVTNSYVLQVLGFICLNQALNMIFSQFRPINFVFSFSSIRIFATYAL